MSTNDTDTSKPDPAAEPLALRPNDLLGSPPDGWDETTLSGLLDFVRGEGRFLRLGPGITTHPESISENQRSIHAALLELERRSLVRRVPVQALWGSSVTWMPNVPITGARDEWPRRASRARSG